MSGPCNYGHTKADHKAAGACVRPLTALQWLRVTHAGTLSGRRIEEALAEAARPGQELRARVEALVAADEAVAETARKYGGETDNEGVRDYWALMEQIRTQSAARLRAALKDPR